MMKHRILWYGKYNTYFPLKTLIVQESGNEQIEKKKETLNAIKYN